MFDFKKDYTVYVRLLEEVSTDSLLLGNAFSVVYTRVHFKRQKLIWVINMNTNSRQIANNSTDIFLMDPNEISSDCYHILNRIQKGNRILFRIEKPLFIMSLAIALFNVLVVIEESIFDFIILELCRFKNGSHSIWCRVYSAFHGCPYSLLLLTKLKISCSR